MSRKDKEILDQISKYLYEEGHLNYDQMVLFIDVLKTLKPKTCLEIGFASGRSAVTTLVTAQPDTLVSVDLSLDYIQGARAHAALLQQDFTNLKIIEGDSKQVLNGNFFATNFPKGLDFAFVDGDHSYAGCTSDLNAVLPYLNSNGVILVDDYRSGPPNGVAYPNVTHAVDDFVLKNILACESWYKDGKGVAIIKRPNSIAQWLKTLSCVMFRVIVRKARTFPVAIKRRLNQISIDKHSKSFIRYNKKVWASWKNKKPESVILYIYHPLSQTLIAVSYFLNVLAKKHNARIMAFSSHRARFPLNIYYRKLDNIYRSFNTAKFICVSLSNEQEVRKRAISQEVIKNLKTKEDVFEITVLDVWIGIDIYESYLRGGKPTIDLNDSNLFNLIEESIGILIFWLDYFKKNRVAAVAASHDCYINEDILCKIAYQKNIPVYLPNIRGIVLADRPFSVHSHFPYYRRMFHSLSTKEQLNAISLAKKQLERRLNGTVGVDMPYSTKSAFTRADGERSILKKSDKIKVLICTHCFYDNPHAYGGMLFLDFYEWLRYLGKMSEKTDYDWYIKMHRDSLPGTEETIRGIIAEFSCITFIPPETSFHQLVNEGLDFALTVYGTVGHELPALGVQVINAGYNPHIAYDFNWHPKSIEEYEYYLLNLDKLHKEVNLQELYEFYYMHHNYVLADDLFLKSFRQFINDLDLNQQIGPAAYDYFLNQLTDAKHEEIIANIQKFIDSGKRHYFSRGPECSTPV